MEPWESWSDATVIMNALATIDAKLDRVLDLLGEDEDGEAEEDS
jgi:hypothetical protein